MKHKFDEGQHLLNPPTTQAQWDLFLFSKLRIHLKRKIWVGERYYEKYSRVASLQSAQGIILNKN